GAVVRDSLAGVLDDATYNNNAVASDGKAVIFAAATLTWTGDVAIGATVTITYSVTVNLTGDHQLVNAVTSDAPGSTCPTGGSDQRCQSTIPVLLPGLTISAVADVPTTAPGATVTYTVVITNSGQLRYDALSVTSSLTDVLDDATYNGDAWASAGAVNVTGSTLTWTGNLLPGDRATVRY